MLFTGEYPEGIRGFLVSAYRYTLRVEAYVGFLTGRYPPLASPRKAAASPAPLATDAHNGGVRGRDRGIERGLRQARGRRRLELIGV